MSKKTEISTQSFFTRGGNWEGAESGEGGIEESEEAR